MHPAGTHTSINSKGGGIKMNFNTIVFLISFTLAAIFGAMVTSKEFEQCTAIAYFMAGVITGAVILIGTAMSSDTEGR